MEKQKIAEFVSLFSKMSVMDLMALQNSFYHTSCGPNTTTQLLFYAPNTWLPPSIVFKTIPNARLDSSLSVVLPEVPAWTKLTKTESITSQSTIRPTGFDSPILLCQKHAKAFCNPLKNT